MLALQPLHTIFTFNEMPVLFFQNDVSMIQTTRGVKMYRSSPLERITINPKIFGGKPIIRGLRISVEMILDLLSQGATEAEILDDYPDLELEDIRACLSYAKAVVANEEIENIRFQDA